MAENIKFINTDGVKRIIANAKKLDAETLAAAKAYADQQIEAGAYELPKASATELGGVMIGEGVNIDATGKISVDAYTKGEADGKFQTAAQVGEIATTKASEKIAALVDGAPESLDTLKEIADTLNKDTEGGVVNSIMTEIAKKATPDQVNTAKAGAVSEAATAAAELYMSKTDLANTYQAKADMPTFTPLTDAEIDAAAAAAVALS